MRITEIIEPSYFIVTAIGFIILSFIQYKKFGKTIETKFLSGMAIFYIVCFITLSLKWKTFNAGNAFLKMDTIEGRLYARLRLAIKDYQIHAKSRRKQ